MALETRYHVVVDSAHPDPQLLSENVGQALFALNWEEEQHLYRQSTLNLYNFCFTM